MADTRLGKLADDLRVSQGENLGDISPAYVFELDVVLGEFEPRAVTVSGVSVHE